MGTVVFLAAFLLAASANPIANSRDDYIEEAKDIHAEDVSHTDGDSEGSTGVDTAHGTKEQDSSIDNNASSTEDAGEVSTGRDTTNPTDITATSSDTTVSTTSTKPETSSQPSNESESTPADADPTDCRNATEANHTYVLCTFSCQGDEMFTAPDNSSCYIYPSSVTPEIPIAGEYDRSAYNAYEIGVCLRGDCVRNSSAAPEAPTEPSPADTPTQRINDTVTTPADADPKDCRNATEKNHTYVLCTYSCQGDEMFTAPDNSSCYIYPANMTTKLLIAGKYSLTEQNAEGTGFCFQGDCVRSLTETPAAPTESSRGPTTTTTLTTITAVAETGVKTESTINDQASVMSEEPPSDVSESFPQHSPSQDTPTENIASPEKPVPNVESTEVEKTSSTATDPPVSMPAALPQDTATGNNNSPQKPLTKVNSSEVEEASSTEASGPVALPGALPAIP